MSDVAIAFVAVLAVVSALAFFSWVIYAYTPRRAVIVDPDVKAVLQSVPVTDSTYPLVFFSANTVPMLEGVAAVHGTRKALTVKEFAFMCRLCMVANEMDIRTGVPGKLKHPPELLCLSSIDGVAFGKREKFCHFYVCRTPNQGTILLFVTRGTTTTQDWECDAAIKLIEAKGTFPGAVHSGFLGLFGTMWLNMCACFLEAQKVCGDVTHVVFAGHSLGAAISTLAAFRFALVFPQMRITLFTFGSPRVGDEKFATAFNASSINSHRVVNEQDYVTKIPVVGFGGGNYMHVRSEIKFDVSPRTADLPSDYTPHNLWTYLYSLDPNSRDWKCSSQFLDVK